MIEEPPWGKQYCILDALVLLVKPNKKRAHVGRWNRCQVAEFLQNKEGMQIDNEYFQDRKSFIRGILTVSIANLAYLKILGL